MNNEEVAELRQHCAALYRIASEVEGIDGVCHSPRHDDCEIDCEECEYYETPMRDRLRALGVDV